MTWKRTDILVVSQVENLTGQMSGRQASGFWYCRQDGYSAAEDLSSPLQLL